MGVGNGATWTNEPLVTIQEADDYATPRGWADWLALEDAEKTAAILDASTFIKVSYPAPYRQTAYQATMLKDAATEAARLTLSGPLIGVTEEPQVLRDKLKDLETQYAEQKPGAAQTSRLSLVTAMLRSAGLIAGSPFNFPLTKA